jgi:hypothetical protein
VPARLLIFAALLLVLAGCTDEAAFDTEVELGKHLVADLQAGRFEAIDAQLDRAAVGDGARATLAKMARLLPAGAPTSVEVAGVNVVSVNRPDKATAQRVALSLQYQFGDKWFLFNARWRRPDTGALLIESLYVRPLRASLQETNRFTLDGKSAIHHTVLAAAIALPLFTLAVLVLCLRTPMPRWRKALWVVAILLGVTTLSLNWTTGAMLWWPLHVQIGSASFAKTALGPAILSVSFPLGAIAFLFRRPSPTRSVSRRRPVRRATR